MIQPKLNSNIFESDFRPDYVSEEEREDYVRAETVRLGMLPGNEEGMFEFPHNDMVIKIGEQKKVGPLSGVYSAIYHVFDNRGICSVPSAEIICSSLLEKDALALMAANIEISFRGGVPQMINMPKPSANKSGDALNKKAVFDLQSRIKNKDICFFTRNAQNAVVPVTVDRISISISDVVFHAVGPLALGKEQERYEFSHKEIGKTYFYTELDARTAAMNQEKVTSFLERER